MFDKPRKFLVLDYDLETGRGKIPGRRYNSSSEGTSHLIDAWSPADAARKGLERTEQTGPVKTLLVIRQGNHPLTGLPFFPVLFTFTVPTVPEPVMRRGTDGEVVS